MKILYLMVQKIFKFKIEFIKDKKKNVVLIKGDYIRRGDLKHMVNVYDFVFTFYNEKFERFKNLLKGISYEK